MEKWRLLQKQTFNSLKEIADYLSLEESLRKQLLNRKEFPLHVPFRIAKKMPKNCISGPLALQFLPLFEEGASGGVDDPVGDKKSSRCDALLHKYEGRALLLTTGACAMHCRYCFRQNYPYKSGVDQAIGMIAKDSSIKEVILSGGDPLSLSDRAITELIQRLNSIDHVEIIRFHTRFLVGIPERITKQFLNTLEESRAQIIFVLHVNCVEELDEDIFLVLEKIQSLRIPVLTQSVLLKGVNDTKEALYNLFWALSRRGVVPYYLHQLDRVKGALHFEVDEEVGKDLIRDLRDCMPGYAVPAYVREVSGDKSKRIFSLEKASCSV